MLQTVVVQVLTGVVVQSVTALIDNGTVTKMISSGKLERSAAELPKVSQYEFETS